MKAVWLSAALVLLATMIAGLARIARGPTHTDRMLSSLLFGTTGGATLLVLSRALDMPEAMDVALVLAVLAAVAGVAFATRGPDSGPPGKEAPR